MMTEAQKRWHDANKERKREYDRAYRVANKQRIAAAKAAHVAANPEADRARKARYRATHRDLLRKKGIEYNHANAAARAEYLRAYQKENAHKVRAWAMKRHAAKLQRTPPWLTEDDWWMIEQAYELAALRTKMLGVQHQVDHILPLRGKTVSRLHVPGNLRVVTAYENKAKGNRLLTVG